MRPTSPPIPTGDPFIVRADGKIEDAAVLTLRMQPVGARGVTLRPRVLEIAPGHRLRWIGRIGMPGSSDAEHVSPSSRERGWYAPLAERGVPRGVGAVHGTVPGQPHPPGLPGHEPGAQGQGRAAVGGAACLSPCLPRPGDRRGGSRPAGKRGRGRPDHASGWPTGSASVPADKHLPHKAALETAIIITGFEEAAAAFESAADAEPLAAVVQAYRAFVTADPRLPVDDRASPSTGRAPAGARSPDGGSARPSHWRRSPGQSGLGLHPRHGHARAQRAVPVRRADRGRLERGLGGFRAGHPSTTDEESCAPC